EVKRIEQESELYGQAKSTGRKAKEIAIRRKRLARLLWSLRAMRHSLPPRDALLMRLGAAKTKAGRAFGFVHIQVPAKTESVTRSTFQFRVNKKKLQQAECLDGHYLLRSNLIAEDPEVLWTLYVQLTQIEAVFRSLKSELGIRPIYHQLEHRAEAHILIAFLAYCLQITLKHRLLIHAPGLTPAAVRSEEHTSELQSLAYLVCRLLLEKKNSIYAYPHLTYVSLILSCLPYLQSREVARFSPSAIAYNPTQRSRSMLMVTLFTTSARYLA